MLQYNKNGKLLVYQIGANSGKLMAECACGPCGECCPPLQTSYTVTISGVTPSDYDGAYTVEWVGEISQKCYWQSQDGHVELQWNKQGGGNWQVLPPGDEWYSACSLGVKSRAFWGPTDKCAPEGSYTATMPGQSYVCTSSCVIT